jgi:small subunit ribosomal protein S20
MAQHISAKKRIRRNEAKAEINRSRMNRIRTFLRKVELAIIAGNASEARSAFQAATPELHRAVNKHTLHRNTVSRKLSRLSARIKDLEVSAK